MILFLLILVALVSPGSVAPVNASGECKAPSTRRVKDVLDEPVECPKGSAGGVCFKNKSAFVIARFSAKGFAESLFFSTSAGMFSVSGFMKKIVTDKYRGWFSQRIEMSERYACKSVYLEEYECLSIEYSQENCMGSMPATIKVVWKEWPE